MEMTIKQLADELAVSKSTIGRAIVQLGFQDQLCKIGNKYMLSETQILQIKLQLSKDEEEKSLQASQKTQNVILQEQLSILNKQLAIKDYQIKILQEQIGQLTTAMESMATALTAAQALHAGTIQKQLTEHSDSMEQMPDQEQPKQKKGIFSRLFGRKEN